MMSGMYPSLYMEYRCLSSAGAVPLWEPSPLSRDVGCGRKWHLREQEPLLARRRYRGTKAAVRS